MVERQDIPSFADLETEFMERIRRVVWCNVATVDTRGRVRSRILHPIWEGPTGWILTRRWSLKARHVERNPYVSLAYVADVAKPVYVDCCAAWNDDPAAKERIWRLLAETPPPLGYDPAPIFERVDHPDLGLFELTPWRVELADFPTGRRVWRPSE